MNDDDRGRIGDAPVQRDFLYQRRLVAFRPFVTDDGVPGLCLRFADGDRIAVRIETPMLDRLHQAIARLKSHPAIGP